MQLVRALVSANRLVTLTGPGGAGKTRLARRSATESIEEFPDGVYFVDLAPLGEADLVKGAVATALGRLEAAFEAIDAEARPALEADLYALLEKFNVAEDGTLVVPSEYLEVVITKNA